MRYEVKLDLDNYPDGEVVAVGGFNISIKNHSSVVLDITPEDADVLRASHGFTVKRATGDSKDQHPANIGVPAEAPPDTPAIMQQRVDEAKAAQSAGEASQVAIEEQVDYPPLEEIPVVEEVSN